MQFLFYLYILPSIQWRTLGRGGGRDSEGGGEMRGGEPLNDSR